MTEQETVRVLMCEKTCNAAECPEECNTACPYYSDDTYTLDELIENAIKIINKLQSRANQSALNYQQKCRDVAELESQLLELQNATKEK